MMNKFYTITKIATLFTFLFGSFSAFSQAGTCADPIPLTCGTSYNGTTTDGQSNFNQYSCATQLEAEKEKIHTITLTQPSDIVATLSNLGGVDLDVHILSACDATTCIARADNSASANGLAAGTYYIVVDGYTGNGGSPSGSYTLTVSCTPSSSTSGTCGAPISLTCGTPYTGTTTDGQSNFDQYGCATQLEGAKEKVHVIGITTPSDITATLSNLGGVDLDVHILSACSAGSCVARGDNFATATNLAVGTYYIVVDGYTGGGANPEGAYTLEITCTPVSNSTNGTCANPIALTCGTPFTGTTSDGQSNFNSYPSCGNQQEGGKEKVHTITLTSTSDVTATLSGMTVDLDVHILTACNTSSCVARDDISATANGLTAGTYYIIVDGYGAPPAVDGAYTLTVNCTPVTGNTSGTCNNPIPLSCGVPYSGSTVGYQDNFSNYNCSSFDKLGAEVIHTITAPGNGNLSVTLTRPSNLDLEVGILSACNASACMDITTAGLGTQVTASISNAVQGQQYYIVVDGDEAVDEGAYTIEVTCPPSTTQGDCSNPIPLTCGTPYNGTTVDGLSNFNTYNCGTQAEGGKEKIHTITLTQNSDITAALSNLGANDLDVHILSSCDANSCIARDDNVATATNLSAGTYYIVVDGYTGGGASPAGSYTLNVTCTPNSGGGTNAGTCSDPIPLTCGTNYNGTTTDGQSNFNTYNCGTQQEGAKEKIHTITLTQPTDLTATLSNLGANDLDVHILSSCDANSCIARGDNFATANGLAAGTYYIVVDGYTGGGATPEGTYTLNLTCTPASTTPGTCGAPVSLTCGTPYNGNTTNGASNFNSYNCGTQQEGAKEIIHVIGITQPSDLTATLSNLGGNDLDVHILSACSANSCIARGDNVATATNLSVGTYYIVVDGYTGGGANPEGAYTLNVTCTPNSGGGTNAGTCSDPIPLTCGTNYNGTTTDGQSNFNTYNCGTQQEGAKEKIHTITLTQPTDLTATLSNLGANDLDVHILSSCDANSCIARGDNFATANGLAAGTYYIVVDGYTGGGATPEGTYTLNLTCTPASTTPGTCGAPVSLTCGTPYNGNTTNGASNFNSYNCGTQQEGAKEIIHTITLTQPSDLTATLSNLGGNDLDVHILSACSANSCIARGDNFATANGLAAGTYYIVVDGYTGGGAIPEGAYTLNVTCTPNSGGGTNAGTCSDPIPLTCGTNYNGTTTDGQSNFNTYNCGTQQEGAKEKIHTITITQQSDLTATLSNLGANDLDVHILSSCDANSCVARGDNVANATALAAGTYYIVVDGYTGGGATPEGNYTLNVTCTPNNSTTVGTCGNPIAITCGVDYNGTTADGQSNYDQYTCGTQMEAAKEKVHAITLTQASDITATLSNLGSNDLDVHILTVCAANGCVSRGDNVATASSLAPGTYYIIVDGYTGGGANPAGPYTLNVTCTPVNGGGGGCTPNGSNQTQSICQGDSYVFGSQTLTTAGTYTETFTNVGGCDSIVNLTLTVNPLPTINAGPDVTVNSGATVTLTATGGVSYVWDNGVQNGVPFTPTGTQTYTVTGTDANGCSNTDDVLVTVNGGTPQPCNELFFSEYIEGSGNNKALEIYNPSTTATVTLSAYSIDIYANGATTPSVNIPLSGTLAPNATFVIVNSNANTALLSLATVGSNTLTFNGDDAVYLMKNTTDTVDIIGKRGEDPGTSWSSGSVATENMTLVRKSSVQIGLLTTPATFNPALEWDALPLDDFSNVGTHTSSCSNNSCEDHITRDETICQGQSLVFNGQTLTTSGTYTETLTNVAGCDSVTTLNLTVLPSQVNVEDTICYGATYQFGTQTLTVTGTYSEVFQNSIGCDSTVYLALFVRPEINVTATEAVCTPSYQFGTQTLTQDGTYTETLQSSTGCDSTVTLTITFEGGQTSNVVAEICQGETYQFGTQTLTNTGSYTEVFTTAGGCDSTVNLTLSVNATPIVTITENNGDLVSSPGNTYQWYYNGGIIQGATNQSYTPTQNGVYTVETEAFNGCTGTGTYNLQNVGVEELLNENMISIIPNPSTGLFTVQSSEKVEVVIYNVIGEVVYSTNQLSKLHSIDLTTQDRGVYMLKVINEGRASIVKRVVLN